MNIMYLFRFFLFFFFSCFLFSQENVKKQSIDSSSPVSIEQKQSTKNSSVSETSASVSNSNPAEGQEKPQDLNTSSTNQEELFSSDAVELSVWEKYKILKVLKEGGWMMFPLISLLLFALVLIIERLVFYTLHKTWNTDHAVDTFLKSNQEEINSIEYQEVLQEHLTERGRFYITYLERGIFLLSGIANVAPLMGFLGTVLGMIEAFASIAAATNVNAKVVALGIQKALVTTAAGLLIAVPAFIAYYIFSHLVQSIANKLEPKIADIVSQKKKIVETIQ